MTSLFFIICSVLSLIGSIGNCGETKSANPPNLTTPKIIDGSISDSVNNTAAFVLVDKESMTLTVINYNGSVLYRFPISCGIYYGNKMRQGDKKTPEGVFRIKGIQNSQKWTHDFGDGKGEISGAYGPWFIRIDVPGYSGIGIHGTHDDGSIGNRVTEGCIRLHNGDVEKLKSVVFVGMMVVVLPSRNDILAND